MKKKIDMINCRFVSSIELISNFEDKKLYLFNSSGLKKNSNKWDDTGNTNCLCQC